MPRRNKRDRELDVPQQGPRARSEAPMWAIVPGYDVRHVGGEKAYRCPGCDHPVQEGVWHLVVVPQDAPEERRHWHTECWRKELRRLGHHVGGGG